MTTTKPFKFKNKTFVARLNYGWSYYMDPKGVWWTFNAQKGWVAIDVTGAAWIEAVHRGEFDTHRYSYYT